MVDRYFAILLSDQKLELIFRVVHDLVEIDHHKPAPVIRNAREREEIIDEGKASCRTLLDLLNIRSRLFGESHQSFDKARVGLDFSQRLLHVMTCDVVERRKIFIKTVKNPVVTIEVLRELTQFIFRCLSLGEIA